MRNHILFILFFATIVFGTYLFESNDTKAETLWDPNNLAIFDVTDHNSITFLIYEPEPRYLCPIHNEEDPVIFWSTLSFSDANGVYHKYCPKCVNIEIINFLRERGVKELRQ